MAGGSCDTRLLGKVPGPRTFSYSIQIEILYMKVRHLYVNFVTTEQLGRIEPELVGEVWPATPSNLAHSPIPILVSVKISFCFIMFVHRHIIKRHNFPDKSISSHRFVLFPES